MDSKSSSKKSSDSASLVETSDFYVQLPQTLLPVVPAPETATAMFNEKVDPNVSQSPFIDQYVSYKVHGLPSQMVRTVMNHQVNDKFLTLAAGDVAQQALKKIKGPKRTKRHKLMSNKQRKLNKLHELAPECENYEMYLPLHDLWMQYAKQTIGSPGDKKLKLAKADWHGAVVQVVKSTNPTYVGVTGIILQETTNTFKIITKQNKYKTIPKADTVFTMQIQDDTLATIYGNHILYKTGDRSVRKFKSKLTIDIGV